MTSHLAPAERRRVAAMTRALYERRITPEEFIDALADVEDPQLTELFNLLEHEPERGGVHGVRDAEYEAYHHRLTELIGRLTSDV